MQWKYSALPSFHPAAAAILVTRVSNVLEIGKLYLILWGKRTLHPAQEGTPLEGGISSFAVCWRGRFFPSHTPQKRDFFPLFPFPLPHTVKEEITPYKEGVLLRGVQSPFSPPPQWQQQRVAKITF